MELHTLPLLTFLLLAVVVSHAAVPAEIYWKTVLPNSPMPKAIRNSLPDPEWMGDKSTSVSVGKGGVTVNVEPHKGPAAKPSGGHTNVNVGPIGGGKRGGGGHTSVGVGRKGGGHTSVNVGPKGGVTVGVKPGKPGKKPVYVGVKPIPAPFDYNYKASETQLHDDRSRALFFLKKDMKLGSQMTLIISHTTNDATFLPRDQEESLPFSSNKMSNILHAFSIQPDSDQARIMENTVKECEEKSISGEKKYCASSLESMVEFTTSTLGKNIRAISTEVEGENIENKIKYTITRVGMVAGSDNKTVACHKKNYPYAVFYCHNTKATSTYMLSLVGEDGSRANAVAVCHEDTSAWNPNHLAFKVLNVKPASEPICHFLPEDHIVWVSN